MITWPPPRPEVADVLQQAALRMLDQFDRLVTEITSASVEGIVDPVILADPVLLAEETGISEAEIRHWLTSTVAHPGTRVSPFVGDPVTVFAQDRHRRGLEPDLDAGWLAAIAAAWGDWSATCSELADDRQLLLEVLDVSLSSFLLYARDSIGATRRVLAEQTANARAMSEAQVLSLIDQIMTDAPLSTTLAESQLGYRLGPSHLGAVIWHNGTDLDVDLETALMEVAALVAAPRPLIATASHASRWVWFNARSTPQDADVARALQNHPGVHISWGRVAQGIDGFRSTHHDAVAGQSVLIRTESPRRAARYDDLAVVDALTRDRATAERLVREVLGPLAQADRDVRMSVLAYIQSGFSSSRAAETLYAHRNTIERRISRANDLSATRIDSDPIGVAVALMIVALTEAD